MKTAITPELVEYAVRHGARQDEVLARVARETAGMRFSAMLMPPEQGALMTMLVRLSGARRCLEVGTFTGYGAICMARGLPADGTLLCLEASEEYAAIARRNLDAAEVAGRVEMRVGPAAEALRAMPEEPLFDFAFLDADKQANPEYYELVLARMGPGGLILVDNAFRDGDVLDPADETSRAVHGLNVSVAADERVDCVLLPLADGILAARKR